MKPRSRHRIVPSRFFPVKTSEPVCKFFHRWNVKEQQKLVRGLKLQRKLNTELDLLLLRKNVPKRTLLEIQNFIKFLKGRVVWRVHQQVRKQKREERKTKVAIEIWAELAQKMAGIHEKALSSAFSQMLVIAATEPCSREHSAPPRAFSITSPVAQNLCTARRKPMSTSYSNSGLPLSPSLVIIQPGGTCKPAHRSPGQDGTWSPSFKNSEGTSSMVQPSSISRTENCVVCTQPRSNVADQASTKPSTPSTPKSNFCLPTSSHTGSTPTQSVPTTVLSSSSSPRLDKQNERQSEEPKSLGKEYTVDFEKIYQCMSNIHMHNPHLILTAMESAVLLDLLMSLPEELPLLDCKELQHHLVHIHTRLTTPHGSAVSVPGTNQRSAPVNPATADVTQPAATADQLAKGIDVSLQTQLVQTAADQKEKKGGDSSMVSRQGHSAKLSVAGDESSFQSGVIPPKDGGNCAETGLFPLNPFMVPVALLKRKES